jgi:hypothetical protein
MGWIALRRKSAIRHNIQVGRQINSREQELRSGMTMSHNL